MRDADALPALPATVAAVAAALHAARRAVLTSAVGGDVGALCQAFAATLVAHVEAADADPDVQGTRYGVLLALVLAEDLALLNTLRAGSRN